MATEAEQKQIEDAKTALKSEQQARKDAEKKQSEAEARIKKLEDANAKLVETNKSLKEKASAPAAPEAAAVPEAQQDYESGLVEMRKQKQSMSQKAAAVDELFKKFFKDFQAIQKG